MELVKWTKDKEKAARQLRQQGYSYQQISDQIGLSLKAVQIKSRSMGWKKGKKALGKAESAVEARQTVEETREIVKSLVIEDIRQTLAALQNHSPDDIDELPQLLTRERIAESVQKRAGTLLGFDETDKHVVNIAILSQLPDDPSASASTTYDS